MPSQPDPRRGAPAGGDEPRWGPATTYRARPRLRGGDGSLPPAPDRSREGRAPEERGGQESRGQESRSQERRGHERAAEGTTYGRPRPSSHRPSNHRPPDHGPASRRSPGASPAAPPSARRPSSAVRRRRAVVGVVALLAVALVAYPVALGLTALGALGRVDALGASAVEDTPGSTYLLVGSDSREGTDIGGDAEGARTDSILLLHVPDGSGPSVLVSLPRDSYVEVPGYYETKINAAYSLGGAPLLVDTVELATGLKVDDYVETGFEGFADVVDAVGGVEMCPPTAIVDPRADLDIPAGCQEMGGLTALGYARTRYEDPRGDLGRADRQRELMAAIAAEGTSPGLLLNPFRAFPTAAAGGSALTVDESTGLGDLVTFARGMRAASSADGVSMTVPVAATDRVTNSGQVVDWDEEQADALWSALRADDTEAVRALADAQAAALGG
ncbi:LCP family protein [Pseudokineococcus marinus]|uniref:LytR family transcriptional regulator n=1 Tax=Pseudokineococcus marinus TaxID=351215 RepID=A0A849BMK5_9ACTN|nr:LCP family protein [Pseudokineococcus marinus]NNH23881.1 LytR family transcriptional regulator [Pseudokineococcus marinus]